MRHRAAVATSAVALYDPAMNSRNAVSAATGPAA
jgi:hypothetical protein